MRHPLVLIISLVFFTLSVSAQEHVIFTYAQPIDEKRNEDISGAYCFFEDWSPAKLYDGTNKNYSELAVNYNGHNMTCLLYTSPSPRDATLSRMPSSA